MSKESKPRDLWRQVFAPLPTAPILGVWAAAISAWWPVCIAATAPDRDRGCA